MLKFSVPNCNTQLRHIFYVHNCFHERNVLWVTVATYQALFKVSNWMCAEIVRNWTYRWTVTEGWIWIRRFYWFPYIQEYEGVTFTNVVLIRIHISNNSTETFENFFSEGSGKVYITAAFFEKLHKFLYLRKLLRSTWVVDIIFCIEESHLYKKIRKWNFFLFLHWYFLLLLLCIRLLFYNNGIYISINVRILSNIRSNVRISWCDRNEEIFSKVFFSSLLFIDTSFIWPVCIYRYLRFLKVNWFQFSTFIFSVIKKRLVKKF